ncbi:3'-5' exonuclease [Methylorubrum extorquens]|uniref:Exonuclease n=1 Tax=Methylorubrum extorquens (strain ATCC 14718 / DSM 1338 / JCM 2805 / NCIMB 9133 / AM1) TaxID=272630 RepID=C5B4H5_METEA|nr:3'-5' exonuclease [Methylorubrum extorquens]ACS43357.1 putative Exonuclease [Methylorubrum extorquens AM1]MCP1545548.1 DNA polymerase-3 subunit epsilon [Methylorubrum extorquens]MCP1591499.1 DNA polymerase-3 subunit epsilon [Methylorubrum extorquens]
MLAAFDTETTGTPAPGLPLRHPRQPRIVEIGCVLYYPDGAVADTFRTFLRPDGFTIPMEMRDLHGITVSAARREGLPAAEAFGRLKEFLAGAGRIAVHFVPFDATMVAIEIAHGAPDPFGPGREFACTSAAAGLAVRGEGHLALDEACAGILGRPPRRHHRALPDALDAMDLAIALERTGHLHTFDPERP